MEVTKKNLRNWLESLDTDDYVGESGAARSCPIATFIKETKSNIEYVVVMPSYVEYGKVNGGREWRKKLPKWANQFIVAVDNWDEYAITAGDALDILEGV